MFEEEIAGSVYTIVLLRKYVLQSREPTFEELLEQIKTLHEEMLTLSSRNSQNMNDALEKQLKKYAWHTTHLEEDSTSTINNVIKASRYAEKHLKLSQIAAINI